MNTIKFRAWDGHNKVMKFYTLKELAGEDKFSYDTEVEAIQSGFDNWEWMLSTGLNDKKGKEIYDGDIVRIDYKDNRYEPVVTTIIWDAKGAAFNVGSGSVSEVSWSHEVVGNIHENPELLNCTTNVQERDATLINQGKWGDK